MSVNKRNVAKLARQIEDEFAKHPIQIPVESSMTVPLLPRKQVNALIQALYDKRAFGIDRIGVLEASAEAGLGLDLEGAKKVYRMAYEEGLVGEMGLAASAYLTAQGRQRVESFRSPAAGVPTSITNTFNGPVTNSQIANGTGIVQNQTNTTIDTEQLDQFFKLVAQFDTSVLSEADRADFVDDVQVIESQRTSQVEASVVRRALRSIQAIAMTATGSASGRLLAEFVVDQMV